nr:MAG TPA: hypothetical protein [Caudoviricetes sp.]
MYIFVYSSACRCKYRINLHIQQIDMELFYIKNHETH